MAINERIELMWWVQARKAKTGELLDQRFYSNLEAVKKAKHYFETTPDPEGFEVAVKVDGFTAVCVG